MENLTHNKTTIATFYKLFDKYRNDIRSDSNVKISLTEITSFLESLNQKFETSNASSHQKVTLNFQNAGSSMGDQMVILTSKTYLKPEQIKDLRLAFIEMRIVPDDPKIQKKLREEGLL
jgi:hypothetical protein